jgi:hypothetical protein
MRIAKFIFPPKPEIQWVNGTDYFGQRFLMLYFKMYPNPCGKRLSLSGLLEAQR